MLKDKILEFDKNVLEVYQEYVNEHEKLNKYRGEVVEGDEDDSEDEQ